MRLRRIHKLVIAVTCLLMYTVYRVTNDASDGNRHDGDSHVQQAPNAANPVEPVRPKMEDARVPRLEKQDKSVVAVQPPVKQSDSEIPVVNPVNVGTNRTGQAERIRQAILEINSREEIHNLARFPLRSNASVVILVMVHKRLEYLRYLIDSLRGVRDIGDSLLIFSHDYYSEEINALVKTVDFCQTMQIFYPYLLQIYENEFPGEDPGDCPRDMKRDKAKERKCNNWEHPDKYGHYREVRFVMTKHHWFWKLQHVFGGLGVTKSHKGLVLLIEEDHYMTPDAYYLLQKMYELKGSKCPECDIFTLGTYEKSRRYKERGNVVDVLQWYSSRHNMGMALDRSTWERLQPCVKEFCKYDDYNWDWTLQHVSLTCLKPSLTVMVPKAPRIFHIGECGIHHKGRCDAAMLVKQLDSTVAASADYLFPGSLAVTPPTRALYRKLPRPNGGWGDVRDHALCMAYGQMGAAAKSKL
ncbi:alpha-1,6-mannosyl-glycoprotein 2-beta-N-acetylglucosaminyltransferase-like [Acanthaster planci]|uniref:Alpha-1,6-mannosyl-glycoprotein 2-beta-N-acetylglucosaminyltransferase n=1 Tax=Acanthaster planci TaxID=133434 RepID=A0A8B7ZEA2_ACAPL|nr:alpha-1,6-mannosyl-glycoprotein 2-beta-N-acetylglucosaminyltransferase-like [Acanthaster planci]XP_022101537.1 alpha-1,6-mannosyl-glycoprotein 2-beta-N-acetylglucosaminyltransferase-like [Acanthaster planci]XP_022101538.1 alpha-1,6-mannosyl-glycoprotein 2-beta-N-acetylglucosaminyltransferase-like [Acanthaster planci]XP_022101539.1 alpha-1,6-mannosyl-glycoprotein 2-beta-N-acetylglucosaminyltransferase-like [Acanthaster planci]XP_022101540.1 alpha-1,6-mannosyl-glycoprotein 2-beta-N-acetylgluco